MSTSIEKEIINQTLKVREIQKSYFSSRSQNALKNAKYEEAKLDKMLLEYKKINELKG